MDGLGLDDGLTDAADGCSSVEPTPRAFAFKKHKMFPHDAADVEKPAEELVEIKPRQKTEDAQNHNTALEASAFDELPGADVYDPSWNTHPLRCEAGNLGKGQERTGRPSLLPNAFTLGSSADLDDDDEQVVEGENLDDIENVDSSLQNPQSPHGSSKYIYGIKRGGAMSFLNRKKGVATVLFHSDEEVDVVSNHLKELLKEDYNGELLPNKGADVKARVKVASEDASAPPSITQFVIAIESGDETGTVRAVLRRSKADKQKSTVAALNSFCVQLSGRYQDVYSGSASLTKTYAEQCSNKT